MRNRLDIAPNVARCADTSEIVLSSRVIAFEATVTADAIVAADSLVDARADMWPVVLLTLPRWLRSSVFHSHQPGKLLSICANRGSRRSIKDISTVPLSVVCDAIYFFTQSNVLAR